jgi:hypothetical protein
VSLQKGAVALGGDVDGAALYVTAKPDAGTGITAQAGKTPPLAAARFASPVAFPFQFTLTTDVHVAQGSNPDLFVKLSETSVHVPLAAGPHTRV